MARPVICAACVAAADSGFRILLGLSSFVALVALRLGFAGLGLRLFLWGFGGRGAYNRRVGHECAVESAAADGGLDTGLFDAAFGLLLLIFGGPLKIPKSLQKAALIDIIKRDKKAVNQWPRFVLLEAIGRAYCKNGQWAHQVDPQVVDETLDRLYA